MPPLTFDAAVAAVRAGELDAETATARLVDQLEEHERLWLLDGDSGFWRGLLKMARAYNTEPIVAGALPRIGLPGLRFCDGPRGVVMGRSTGFPAVIARAASWDRDLEERVGRVIGAEARAQGANFFGGVVANLARHPAWGRTQESYGEDPVLIGVMASALTRGVRTHVMACVKHFALNSIEDARFTVDVRADPHALHEVYLPHFRAVVEAGADAVGTSYNRVNGIWAGQSRELLTEILRDEWGFDGFVMTDFMWGVRDPIGSLPAGQDVEMPFRQQRARRLPGALRDGRLSWRDVDTAARRIVGTQLRHAASLGPAPDPAVVACPEHRALARAVAAQGMVLLRNEPVAGAPVLPLAGATVAVVGALATTDNMGDAGSSDVRPPDTSTVLDGLREALGAGAVLHDTGEDPAAAARLAAQADAAVVVVGLRPDDEGEGIVIGDPRALTLAGPPFTRSRVARATAWLLRTLWPRLYPGGGDRRDLRMPAQDEALVRAVAAANPRTVAVVIGGSVLDMESWREEVPAILLAWYPGMEGGRAVADVVLGAREPGGRLPMVVAADPEHLPPFDAEAEMIVYDAWAGQRRLDREGNRAAYPLGFGLGYTTFELDDLRIEDGADGVVATVSARNTGDRPGSTVVQLYAYDADEAAGPPVRRLVGFARVGAEPGERCESAIPVDLGPLSRRNPVTRAWTRTPGSWHVRAAQHAYDDRGPGQPLEPSRSADDTP
ncbi:MAG: beta-glucosidase family protein [Solirubrobacteraceae bacterium]